MKCYKGLESGCTVGNSYFFFPKERAKKFKIKGSVCHLGKEPLHITIFTRIRIRTMATKTYEIEKWKPSSEGKFTHSFETRRPYRIRAIYIDGSFYPEGTGPKDTRTKGVKFCLGKKFGRKEKEGHLLFRRVMTPLHNMLTRKLRWQRR